MSPRDRKAVSELKLRALGVPVNEHLPVIEAECDVEVRSQEEVLRRLVALWAVVDKAFLKSESETAVYISSNEMESWLSKLEREFLFDDKPNERDAIHFSWQLEALYFVAWCAGLLECSEVPKVESSVKPILDLFPNGAERPERLRGAIRLRSKREVLDRADILYRLHWAVRNGELNDSGAPDGIDSGVVQEWHRAVNWMTQYDSEDDWDQVGTDT
jgi:Domain of unknown function (DUF4272)